MTRMTVRELKEALKDQPDDLEVRIFISTPDAANFQWFQVEEAKFVRSCSIASKAFEIVTGKEIFW